MLSNQKSNRKASMPKDVIAKSLAVLRNTVSATRVEYLAPIFVYAKAARIVTQTSRMKTITNILNVKMMKGMLKWVLKNNNPSISHLQLSTKQSKMRNWKGKSQNLRIDRLRNWMTKVLTSKNLRLLQRIKSQQVNPNQGFRKFKIFAWSHTRRYLKSWKTWVWRTKRSQQWTIQLLRISKPNILPRTNRKGKADPLKRIMKVILLRPLLQEAKGNLWQQKQ